MELRVATGHGLAGHPDVLLLKVRAIYSTIAQISPI